MECQRCGESMVAFGVAEQHREHAPGEAAEAAICPRCLALAAADEAPAGPPFDRIADVFPDDPAGAVPLALGLGLLDSLALNRGAVEELFDAAEQAGVDVPLVLDRLHAQGSVQPPFDLSRRRHQLEQLRD